MTSMPQLGRRGIGEAGNGCIEGNPIMQLFRRRQADTGANEIAVHAVKHSDGGQAAVISGIALVFSAYSLWKRR